MDNCIRRCCGCREMKNKSFMLRVLRTPNGEFIFDETKNSDGRGAYICMNDECISKVIKTKGLNVSFHQALPGSIYGELEEIKKGLNHETR